MKELLQLEYMILRLILNTVIFKLNWLNLQAIFISLLGEHMSFSWVFCFETEYCCLLSHHFAKLYFSENENAILFPSISSQILLSL